jgi:DNA-binding CsgD family transcriptional regulator
MFEESALWLAEQHVPADWTPLLDAVGTQRFEHALSAFLAGLVGSEACAAFEHASVGTVATCGSCSHVGKSVTVLDGHHSADHPGDWISFGGGLFVAVIGPMRWSHLAELGHRLAGVGRALSAILDMHLVALRATSPSAEPLSSLCTIEQCLAEASDLPRREAQVCARVLYGLSSAGIGIDLDVGETTVKTYRKRAYRRLSIGCERELVTWYLRTWSRWRHSESADAAVHGSYRPHVTGRQA